MDWTGDYIILLSFRYGVCVMLMRYAITTTIYSRFCFKVLHMEYMIIDS